MNRARDPRWLLILIFLGIIGIVPLIQTALEIRDEEGVRAMEVFGQFPTAASLRAYERRLEEASWATKVTRPWIQFAHFAFLRDGGTKCAIGLDGWYFYKPSLNYMLERPVIRKTVDPLNDPFTAIADFRDQLAARGIQLVVMPVPNKESVYPDKVTPRMRNSGGVRTHRTQDLLRRLRTANVEVIDLFDHFQQLRKQPSAASEKPLYLAQDTHWSPAGVAHAAKIVSRRLMQLGWIQPGRVDYAERLAPVRRLGDVLRMLQAPLIERRVTPEAVPCVQVVRLDNGQPYAHAGDAEILVLGDSFMRIYQQDEPMSAGFISHLAKELKQPLMAVVNDGGGSTLVRQELRGTPALLRNKKVVLWEFVERDIGLGLHGWQKVALPPDSQRPSPPTASNSTGN